jgi:ATP-dependent DNA helicase RecG
MLESMKEWNLPDPDYTQEAIHGAIVRVTLKNNNDLRRRVLDRDL